MKTIYTVRWADGLLMSFNGASWATVGSYVPSNWTNGGGNNRTHSLFVYQGNLYGRYTVYNSNVITYITEFSGTDMSVVYTYNYTSPEPNYGDNSARFWSNSIQYKGKVYWLEVFADESPGHIYLCTFYISGGTYYFSRRVTEYAQTTNQSGERSNSQLSYGCAPQIVPYRDRLCIVPPTSTGHGYGSQYKFYWSYISTLDIDQSSGVVTATPISILTQNNNVHYTQFDVSSMPPATTTITNYDLVYAYVTSWGQYMYAITLEGKFYRIDPVGGTRTLIVDYSIDSNFLLSSGQTFTTDTTNSSYSLCFSNSTSSGAYGYPWQNWPTGCVKFKILNYGGVSSTTKYALKYDTAGGTGSQGIQLYDSATGAHIAAQSSGTQFQCYWTWFGATYNDVQYTLQNIFSCVYSGVLYIIKISSVRLSDSGSLSTNPALNPPSVVIRYDGSTTPTVTAITNNGYAFIADSGSWDFDEAQGLVNFLTIDSINHMAHHYRFTLGTTTTVQDMGTPFAKTNDVSSDFTGFAQEAVISYDYGDVTATIQSRTVNQSAQTITINYTLWGDNADTVSIAVEHELDTGVGAWVTSTQKSGQGEAKTSLASSSGGTTHTFVHDMNTDYPSGFTGSIQHRIRVTSQTRN